mmetsp:Transcript_59564/g.159361  ORF Transcript_59564/g.159361 Transcript_59564/m.159361 type:complete len:526 (+) Transcript_59564:80-1657(+)
MKYFSRKKKEPEPAAENGQEPAAAGEDGVEAKVAEPAAKRKISRLRGAIGGVTSRKKVAEERTKHQEEEFLEKERQTLEQTLWSRMDSNAVTQFFEEHYISELQWEFWEMWKQFVLDVMEPLDGWVAHLQMTADCMESFEYHLSASAGTSTVRLFGVQEKHAKVGELIEQPSTGARGKIVDIDPKGKYVEVSPMQASGSAAVKFPFVAADEVHVGGRKCSKPIKKVEEVIRCTAVEALRNFLNHTKIPRKSDHIRVLEAAFHEFQPESIGVWVRFKNIGWPPPPREPLPPEIDAGYTMHGSALPWHILSVLVPQGEDVEQLREYSTQARILPTMWGTSLFGTAPETRIGFATPRHRTTPNSLLNCFFFFRQFGFAKPSHEILSCLSKSGAEAFEVNLRLGREGLLRLEVVMHHTKHLSFEQLATTLDKLHEHKFAHLSIEEQEEKPLCDHGTIHWLESAFQTKIDSVVYFVEASGYKAAVGFVRDKQFEIDERDRILNKKKQNWERQRKHHEILPFHLHTKTEEH